MRPNVTKRSNFPSLAVNAVTSRLGASVRGVGSPETDRLRAFDVNAEFAGRFRAVDRLRVTFTAGRDNEFARGGAGGGEKMSLKANAHIH